MKDFTSNVGDDGSGDPGESTRAGPTPKRRWYQFSLASLLGFVVVAAFGALGLRMYAEPFRRQQEVVSLVAELRGRCETVEAERWLRWLGTQHHVTKVFLADCDEPDKYLPAVSRLPKLELLVVGGLKFNDEHAARLHKLRSLRGLILDSTIVSPEAEDALRAALPNADVYASARRAMTELGKAGSFGVKQQNANYPELVAFAGNEWFEETASYTSRPGVETVVLEHLRAMRGLETLDFRYARVGAGELAHLEPLKELKQLFLDHTRVTDDALLKLTGLSKLELLSLDGTNVTDAGLEHLKSTTQLRLLSLDDTKITDAGLVYLNNLSQLKILLLRRTRVTDGGVFELQRALPNCTISR